MHDPKFEKDVQQKMEELSFAPSEAVWLKVEKAVQGEKKRRVIPFWWILIPAVMLLGGGIYVWSGRGGSGGNTVADVVKGAGASGGAAEKGAVVPAGDASVKPAGEDGVVAGGGVKTGAAGAGVGTGAEEGVTHEAGAGGKPGRGAGEGLRPGRQADAGTRPGRSAEEGVTRGRGTGVGGKAERGGEEELRPETATLVSHELVSHENDKTGLDAGTGAGKDAGAGAGKDIKAGRNMHLAVSPGLSPIGGQGGMVKAMVPTFAKASPPVKLPSPKRPWEAGFMAGGGVSSLNQGVLEKSSIQSYDYRNYAAITGTPQSFTTEIRPGPSFFAGVLVRKGLSKNFSMSFGLDLHYYSSRILTGQKVDGNLSSAMPSTSYLLTSSNATQAAAYPYYAVGDDQIYTNRYYFLELPASVSWQVGHNRRMPLYWDAGVNMSYMLASSALYYNLKSNVFYKDGSVINKVQTSVFTGLMVGLPIHGATLLAGPQLQYGFTDLLKSQGSSNQHILYGGIKLVFLPGKAKRAAVTRPVQ